MALRFPLHLVCRRSLRITALLKLRDPSEPADHVTLQQCNRGRSSPCDGGLRRVVQQASRWAQL